MDIRDTSNETKTRLVPFVSGEYDPQNILQEGLIYQEDGNMDSLNFDIGYA